MNYLIQQMWMCLLLAAVIGALIGWLLAKASYQSKLKDLEESWQGKLDKQAKKPALDVKSVKKFSVPAATVVATESDEIAEPVNLDVSTELDQTSYDIEEVEGIGPNYGKKLRDMGIHSTQQLLAQAYNMDGQMHIAEHIGIEDFVIRKWASMCDVMRLQGVNGKIAEYIVNTGIDSTQDLGKQNATALLEKLSANGNNEIDHPPNQDSLNQIIRQAKELKAIISDD